jgi:hypothetical protein
MTVGHLRDGMSSMEYQQWKAYYTWENAMRNLQR